MPVGVCFHPEEPEELGQWKALSRAWGVDRLAAVGARLDFVDECFGSFEKFAKAHQSELLIYCESPWSFEEDMSWYPLHEFIHPVNCWYVFGSSAGFKPRLCDNKIWLGVLQREAVRLEALQVAPIVLHDRWVKTLSR